MSVTCENILFYKKSRYLIWSGAGGGGVRNTLVSSIASNIFDTLKSNDDIAAILNGVLDPARTDKVVEISEYMGSK